jgi:hypothetical protein
MITQKPWTVIESNRPNEALIVGPKHNIESDHHQVIATCHGGLDDGESSPLANAEEISRACNAWGDVTLLQQRIAELQK